MRAAVFISVQRQSDCERALLEGERCDVREYVEGDDDLGGEFFVCDDDLADLNSENWEENFFV